MAIKFYIGILKTTDMEQKKGFIKIRVWLPVNAKDVADRADGGFIPTHEFLENSYESDIKFREPIIVDINNAVGLFNWAIQFSQLDEVGYLYEGMIYCEPEHFITIESIIRSKMNHIKFHGFRYGGTIDAYLY